MNNSLFSNLYLCLDRETKIVIWAKPNWSGFPNLKSSDVNLFFLNFKINKQLDLRHENFENFEIVYTSVGTGDFEMKKNFTLLKRAFEISEEQKDKFALTKIKCHGIYHWLDGMNEYLRKFNGILPDIYVADSLMERTLSKNEYYKIKQLIEENINEYYDSLWACNTVDEFQSHLSVALKNVSFY